MSSEQTYIKLSSYINVQDSVEFIHILTVCGMAKIQLQAKNDPRTVEIGRLLHLFV